MSVQENRPVASPSQTASSPDDGGVAAALGRIPSGLFVVTWREQEGDAGEVDRGMLASWVMQAGFDPPAVSIAIGTSRGLLAAIDAGRSFIVNVLAESQRPLVARFGRPAGNGYDPFADLPIERGPCGAAVLAPASAWLECRAASKAAAGDHVVVVATVHAAAGTPAIPGTSAPDSPIVHIRKNGLRY